jgi:F-type H+-transporting ATPase subunit delta
VDEIKRDIELIRHWYEEIEEIKILLEHPVIKASRKNEVLSSFFKDNINHYTLSFLHLIVNKKRENHLLGMCIDFIDLYKKKKGLKTAVLTTAFELSRTHKTNIKRSIEKVFKSEIELNTKVNENLIGGLIIQVDDRQLDLSVSRQIQQLRNQFTHIDFNNKKKK